MKWSFAVGGMFALGIIGIAAIVLFQKLTTSNENDYYLLKEITEAAMFDSVDLTFYDNTGNVKIVKEKFVENFTRRYAESTLFIGSKYIISFYSIIEEPPKVSIIINDSLGKYQLYNEKPTSDYNVNNYLTGILEFVGSSSMPGDEIPGTPGSSDDYQFITKTLEKTYYSSIEVGDGGVVRSTQPIRIPEELIPIEEDTQQLNFKMKPNSLKIKKVYGVTPTNNISDVLRARLKKKLDWPKAEEYEDESYKVIDTDKMATSLINGTFDFYYCNCNPNYSITDVEVKVNKDSDMCVGNKYKDFWIHWDAKTAETDKSEMLLKFTVLWEYEEYKYQ